MSSKPSKFEESVPSYAFDCFRLLPCVSPPSDRKPILLLLLAWCDVERGSSKSFFAMIDDLLRPVSKGEKISSVKEVCLVDVASKFFVKSRGKRLFFSSRFSAVVVALEKPRSLEVSFLSAAKTSDLGTLGVVFLLWLLGGPLLELTHVQFFRGVFKSCQIISKPKYHFVEVCSRVARFYKQSNIFRGDLWKCYFGSDLELFLKL